MNAPLKTYRLRPCLDCGKNEYSDIPKTNADFCVECGFVWVKEGIKLIPSGKVKDWLVAHQESLAGKSRRRSTRPTVAA